MDMQGEEVHYVLNDAEFVLHSDEIKEDSLSDIIYSDGTRAILVDEHGQIIQGDSQTVVLQESEDLNQYYIHDENGEILVTDDSANQSVNGTEVMHYIEDDCNLTEEPQVIYVNEDGFAIQDSDLSQYHIAEAQEGDSFPLKTLKLETQVVDLGELIRQGQEDTIIENINEDNGYQYAILKDGKLHIQPYTGEIFPSASKENIEEQQPIEKESADQEILDFSKITGRNLLTGQTVSLHSYIDKLQKKNRIFLTNEENESGNHRKRKIRECDGLQGLLNKKLTLGKTTSGKRLVGKIVHIEKKMPAEESKAGEQNMSNIVEESNLQMDNKVLRIEESVQPFADDYSHEHIELANGFDDTINGEDASEITHHRKSNAVKDKKKIALREKIVSKECFDQISRTLSGLMSMDSVKKKLLYRNIIVKVVEKKYVEWLKNDRHSGFTKNISYSVGYMEEEFVVNDEGDVLENWTYLPDANTRLAIFGGTKEGEEDEQHQVAKKYLETTNVTLMITQEKYKERVIRVILNPASRCSICYREFLTNLQLRVHVNNVHKIESNIKLCEICGDQFEDFNSLQEHRRSHVEQGKLFPCLVSGCEKFFLSAARLKRHSVGHNPILKPLECSVCLHRCSSEAALKKHLLTHMGVKTVECETCAKIFTNQSDLIFHKRLHDPYKIFSCQICQRTFSRHSNLQRHIEIHKGSGALFQCAVCGCSYHYMSSLTRHVVQCHIKRSDSHAIAAPDDHENEES